MAGFDLAVAEAALAAGDDAGALRTAGEAQAAAGVSTRSFQAALAGTEAVALLRERSDRAEVAFGDLLSQAGALRPANGLFLVRVLRQAGLSAEADDLLDRLRAAYPDGAPVLAAAVRSAAAAGDVSVLRAALASYLRTRKPSQDVLEAALPRLEGSGDAALRSRVRDAIARGPAAAPSEGWERADGGTP